MNELTVNESERDGIWIFQPVGRLDPAGGPCFEAACNARIQEGKVRIVLDLAGVDFVSSAGLRVILGLVKAIETAGGGLALCSLQPMVAKVFHHSGFDAFLRIENSPDQALAALAPPPGA